MIWLLGKINMCAVVPRKWSEGPQKGPEIDKLSSPLFPALDDDVVTSRQNAKKTRSCEMNVKLLTQSSEMKWSFISIDCLC